MDPITHGLLGAAVTQSLFIKRLPKTWLVGSIAAVLPDLDVVIQSKNNPALFLEYHRQFSHSLLFIPLGALVAWVLCWMLIRLPRKDWLILYLAACIAYATHGLLDALTAYGTMLFWPFSAKRVAWDIIAIVDPLVTLPLLIGVIWSGKAKRALPALMAVMFVMLYLLFGTWQHHRALGMQQAVAANQKQVIIKGRAVPEIGQVFAWHSLYIADSKIFLNEIRIPLLNPPHMMPGTVVPLFTEASTPSFIKNDPFLWHNFKVFVWFSDSFVSPFNLQPLVLMDMRYLYSIKPLMVLWGLEFPSKSNEQFVLRRALLAPAMH